MSEIQDANVKGCKNLTFEDCQLNILRDAMDDAEKNLSKKVAQSPVVKNIFTIIETFISKHKLMIYGGTAINNILPPKMRFYNTDVDVPDYDVFSPNAIRDVKELCDIFYKAGYKNVQAKTANHIGTYKVYVNYIPVVDVTHMDERLLDSLFKDSIEINGLHYSPINLLRLSMYAELSRPESQPSRWEKVFKRLVILNKAYPFYYNKCKNPETAKGSGLNKPDFLVIRDALIEKNVIFIGGYANTLFGRYMKHVNKKFDTITHFDALSDNPKDVAHLVKEQLDFVGHSNIVIKKRKGYDELIPPSYVVTLNEQVVCVIYKTTHCYAYNEIVINGKTINIASIDTLLHFYLAFYYASNTKYKSYYKPERLLCMAQFLFEIQEHNKLNQHGLLKRFVINCKGHEETREELRQILNSKYNELKKSPNPEEQEKYFLKYSPGNQLRRDTSIIHTDQPNKLNVKRVKQSSSRSLTKTPDAYSERASQADDDYSNDRDSDSGSDSDSDSGSDSDSDNDVDNENDDYIVSKSKSKTKSRKISDLNETKRNSSSRSKTKGHRKSGVTKKNVTKKKNIKKTKKIGVGNIFNF
jgi:hypothetical protein